MAFDQQQMPAQVLLTGLLDAPTQNPLYEQHMIYVIVAYFWGENL